MEKSFENTLSRELPKSEIELTMEQADELLRNMKLYTDALLERKKELEEKIASMGGRGTLEKKFEELKHDMAGWREIENDFDKGKIESVFVSQV